MKPSRKPPSATDDLSRSRLENIIDMGHELVQAGTGSARRNPSISRRISRNRLRGTATSASWNLT